MLLFSLFFILCTEAIHALYFPLNSSMNKKCEDHQMEVYSALPHSLCEIYRTHVRCMWIGSYNRCCCSWRDILVTGSEKYAMEKENLEYAVKVIQGTGLKGWKVGTMNRSDRLVAVYYHNKIFRFCVRFLRHRPQEEIRDAAIHVATHALLRDHHHNREWKEKALMLGLTRPCNTARHMLPLKLIALCHCGKKEVYRDGKPNNWGKYPFCWSCDDYNPTWRKNTEGFVPEGGNGKILVC